MIHEIPNPITKEFLEAEAQSVKFTHITGTLTHCAITVEGGFIFTGESACADPANYDPVKGEKYAHENAISKMWLPYGFLLKHQLMQKELDVNLAPKTSKERHVLASISDIKVSAGTNVGLSFGAAIEALERGERVMRAGWNGKDMFVYYVPAASYPMQRNNLRMMGGIFPDDMVPYRAYLALKTAQGDIATWTPSCSDALAKDWIIV